MAKMPGATLLTAYVFVGCLQLCCVEFVILSDDRQIRVIFHDMPIGDDVAF